MTIKEGYASKPTHIKVYPRMNEGERSAEIWLDQEGVKRTLVGTKLVPASATKKYKQLEVLLDESGNRVVRKQTITEVEGHETLAYATLDELLALRDEINNVIQELIR